MEAETQPATEQTAPPAGEKKPRKAKAPKPAPIALKDIPDQLLGDHAEKLLIERTRLKDAMKEVSAIRGKISGILDVAKKDGIPKQMLKDYADDMDQDSVKQRERIEFNLRMAKIMRNDEYLEQMEMLFGAPEQKKAVAPKAEGRAAGKAGRSAAENPHAAGTEAHQEWDLGWRAGQADIVKGMAPKGRAKTADATAH